MDGKEQGKLRSCASVINVTVKLKKLRYGHVASLGEYLKLIKYSLEALRGKYLPRQGCKWK
jgi:hypothetical protein